MLKWYIVFLDYYIQREYDMIQQVKEIIARQLRISPDEISDNAVILTDLGADSLDLVEILNTMEEKLHITISDEEAAEIKTIKDAADFLEKKLKK